MKKLLATASLLLCVALQPAHATSGNGLMSHCEDFTLTRGQSSARGSACISYIYGSYETLIIMDAFKRFNICPPEERMDGNQLVLITKKYMKDHPEELHYMGANIVFDALREAYPCKE